MKVPLFALIVCSVFTLIQCYQYVQSHNRFQFHQVHQLTTLEVQNLNQFTYQNLRHHKQHHQASSGKDAFTLLLIQYLLGPVLFLSSFATIWLNQKKSVLDHKRLLLAKQICKQANPLNKQQILQNQGNLTYVTGFPKTTHTIADQISSVSVTSALKLVRTVEVMQWRVKNPENKNNNIEYVLDWCKSNDQTAQTKNNSPQHWFMSNQTFYNPNVFIGEYNISSAQIDMCKQSRKIIPNTKFIEQIQINKKLRQKGIIIDDYIYFASPVNNQMDGEGALRVKYEYCPISQLTIVAKTINKTFQSFNIDEYQNGGKKIQEDELPVGCICCACVGQYLVPITEINFLYEKTLTKEQIFDEKTRQSKKFTFIVRGVSFLMMIVGFCLLFSPLIDLLGFVPFVGGFLKGSLALIVTVGGLIICIPLWIITFSIAWTWYHPKIGLIFLGIGLLILSGLLFYNQISKENSQTVSPTPSSMHHLIRQHIY